MLLFPLCNPPNPQDTFLSAYIFPVFLLSGWAAVSDFVIFFVVVVEEVLLHQQFIVLDHSLCPQCFLQQTKYWIKYEARYIEIDANTNINPFCFQIHNVI